MLLVLKIKVFNLKKIRINYFVIRYGKIYWYLNLYVYLFFCFIFKVVWIDNDKIKIYGVNIYKGIINLFSMYFLILW